MRQLRFSCFQAPREAVSLSLSLFVFLPAAQSKDEPFLMSASRTIFYPCISLVERDNVVTAWSAAGNQRTIQSQFNQSINHSERLFLCYCVYNTFFLLPGVSSKKSNSLYYALLCMCVCTTANFVRRRQTRSTTPHNHQPRCVSIGRITDYPNRLLFLVVLRCWLLCRASVWISRAALCGAVVKKKTACRAHAPLSAVYSCYLV